jgi:chemotaxis protein MotB
MTKNFLFVLSTLLICSSCIVSKKKYETLLAQNVRTEADLAARTAQLDSANNSLSALTERLHQLKKDTASIGEERRAKILQLIALENEHQKLTNTHKNLIASNGKQNRDLVQQQEQLLVIQENLERTRRQNDSLSANLIDREKKVRELEQVLASKDKAVLDLKNKISGALLNFKENDITVKVKNGKVYVSLAEQLLFGSGSIDVDAKGVSALQQLAKAVKDQKDIQILVEGHTDNVPVSKKSQYMQDNWDLSVMRATSITRILTRAGVLPRQITAAGHGEYAPLSTNDSAASKQKNRRTEIIITPNLDELFRILESN